MSTQTEITRIQTARNKMRNKLEELGLVTSTAKLDKIADEIEKIDNQGAVSASVQEGATYTIPKGYHNGSGTVSGVGGGGNYSLQSKTVTPTKSQQNVTPDDGNYGLSDVTVAPIPASYQDVSIVTAEAEHVLANKVFVNSDGETVAGTMPNNGKGGDVRLDATNQSYEIQEGYYTGGRISIATINETVTPSKEEQQFEAPKGFVYSKFTVNSIPIKYADTSDATATSEDVLYNKIAYSNGTKITGIMMNRGAITQTLDGSKTSYTIPKGYHDGKGSVSISTETKSITPTKLAQTVLPGTNKVLSSVSVAAIPDEYVDTSDATATAADMLADATAYANGVKVTGSIPRNGAMNKTIDGLTTTSVSIPAGHTTGGTVSLTDDIERALAAI